MALYVVRRLLILASVVVVVSFASFIAFGLTYDPAFPLVLANRPAHAFVQQYYHLNDPILDRYWRWMSGIFRHGFGTTVSTDVSGTVPRRLRTPGLPIGPIVGHATAITAQLVAFALVLVVAGSAIVGTVSARRRRYHADVATRAVAYLAAAVPTFLVGDLILRALAPQTSIAGAAPAAGSWFLLGPPTGGLVDWFRHMTLPAVAMALGLVGIYARYVRSAMVTALREPHVIVARAKGLPEHSVTTRHALRTALIPFVAILSLELGGIVGVSIVADGVFRTGGLATAFLQSLGNADPFLLTALLVATAVIVCGFMLLGDIVIAMLDPRIRFARP